MATASKKGLSLYLTSWQINMIKDLFGLDCHVWQVDFDPKVKLLYGTFDPTLPKVPKMYLAGWQMQQIKDELGVTCHYIELRKGEVVKYRPVNR